MVEHAATPRIPRARRQLARFGRALTTPLRVDDYLALVNPSWSAREATATVAWVQPEADGAATVALRPTHPWPGHRPGQYLRIGAEINGIRQWRAYTITSDPDHPDGLVSVTVKRVEDGGMSPFFTGECQPGMVLYLGEVEGEFQLPEPVPPKLLMVTAGSGITPVWSLVRELERRGALASGGGTDVIHVHSARTPEHMIFGDVLRGLAARRDGYTLIERHTKTDGRLTPAELTELVPDRAERATYLSGPRDLIDAAVDHWDAEGLADQLTVERFQPVVGTGAGGGKGGGGTVRFLVTDCEATCEPGVSLLVGGEQAGAKLPFGCRMGICHTCVGKLRSGQVRDLRSGDVHGEIGQTVRTCVNGPEGDVEIEL